MHRSHSSSKVLWAMVNGPPMADFTLSPTTWASSRVGWPDSTTWADRARTSLDRLQTWRSWTSATPGIRAHDGGELGQVDVGGGRFQQDVEAGAQQAVGLHHDDQGATTSEAMGSANHGARG